MGEGNMTIKNHDTQYGFKYGSMLVERMMEDPKFGVVISIKSKHNKIELRGTPGGRVVIHKWEEK